jgi:tRNA threonylcarbamoyladenosine biosynthesis protein TsaB
VTALSNLLAVDSSFGVCSVALFCNGVLKDVREELVHSRQAESLLPLIQDLLSSHSVTYKNLDALVSTVGPGSFTGLRIGLTAVKGLSLVSGVRGVGVTTLDACAQEYSGQCVVVLNAMRNEVYLQRFAANGRQEEGAQLISLDEVNEHLRLGDVVVGNAREVLEPVVVCDVEFAEASPHAKLAGEFVLSGGRQRDLEPLYIRKPDAKLPTKAML